MSGSVLDRYTARAPEPAKKLSAEEPDALDDLGSFGLLRGMRERALYLELRLRDGSSTALNYGYLTRADFDPSHGIALNFSGVVVTICGTNLGAEIRPNVRLFQSLLRHRVPWLREADRTALLQAHPGVVIIEGITIES